MKNYEQVPVTRVENELRSVVCDCCGTSYEVTYDEWEHGYTGNEQGYFEIYKGPCY